MRKLFLILILALTACAQSGPGTNDTEIVLTVFAAASMTETLEQISELYKKTAPDVVLKFNFDSSGTLKTQIQEGAECDVFISAGQLQMDQLDAAVNTDGLDFILQGTRVDILENKIVLCVPEGNPANITGFDDLAYKLENTDILFAMGNSDVPVGQYTKKILSFYSLNEDALANAGKISYGSNVKEVTSQLSEAAVSGGVVYCTDAYVSNLQIVDYATLEMCGQVIYPAGIIKTSGNAEAAKLFLDFLQGSEAMAVFESVGFAPPGR